MKAVVKFAPGIGHVGLREVPEPLVGPQQVKIEVKAAGICGTDIHIYHDQFRGKSPVILGHEYSGVVVEKGEQVVDLELGDRVISESVVSYCGTCYLCETGHYNVCLERQAIGVELDGAFAKYVVVPAKSVFRLPEGVNFVSGALVEPLSCCTHGILEQTHISAGDIVLVSGPGTIGLLASQVAKAEGAFVVVCGTSSDGQRLNMAKTLGADHSIIVPEEDLRRTVGELTYGRGADVVIECAGSAASAQQCLEVVKRRGKYLQLGLFSHPLSLDFNQIVYKEVQIIPSVSHTRQSWESALKLLVRNVVKTAPLVSHRFPLTKWQEAFSVVERCEGIKVILIPED